MTSQTPSCVKAVSRTACEVVATPKPAVLVRFVLGNCTLVTDPMRDKELAVASCDELYDLITRDFWYVGSIVSRRVDVGVEAPVGVCVCVDRSCESRVVGCSIHWM